MKMLLLFSIFFMSFGISKSYASDLIIDSCISPVFSTYVTSFTKKIRCEDLRSVQEGISIASVAILPASTVLRVPGVKATLGAELASMGLTLANPAILTVTVVGAVGVATLYFVLKKTLEECEQENQAMLKQSLLQEIERKYGLSPHGSGSSKDIR